jgi:hypothetical protein
MQCRRANNKKTYDAEQQGLIEMRKKQQINSVSDLINVLVDLKNRHGDETPLLLFALEGRGGGSLDTVPLSAAVLIEQNDDEFYDTEITGTSLLLY